MIIGILILIVGYLLKSGGSEDQPRSRRFSAPAASPLHPSSLLGRNNLLRHTEALMSLWEAIVLELYRDSRSCR